MSWDSASPCSDAARYQRAAAAASSSTSSPLKYMRREVALADRIARFRRQRQPAQGQRAIRRNAKTIGEAGADIALRPRDAGVGQRAPDLERPCVVALFGRRVGGRHLLGGE